MNLRASRTGGGENIILAGGPLDGFLIEIPTHMQSQRTIAIPTTAAAQGLGIPSSFLVDAPKVVRYRSDAESFIP